MSISRRSFVSGVAAALGYAGLVPADLLAQGARGQGGRGSRPPLDLDKVAKPQQQRESLRPA
jgi:hypothetical protein